MKSFPVCKESKNSSEQCSILYLNCSVMFKPRIKRINDFWNFLSRDSKFLIPEATQERIQNFWSPKQQRKEFRISDPQRIQRRIPNFCSPKDSEFLILNNDAQKGSEFLIPYTQNDAESLISYKGTEKYSEFLISQRTQEKIQSFWSTEAHGRERIQNVWSPTEQDSQLFIPKEQSLERNQNFSRTT